MGASLRLRDGSTLDLDEFIQALQTLVSKQTQTLQESPAGERQSALETGRLALPSGRLEAAIHALLGDALPAPPSLLERLGQGQGAIWMPGMPEIPMPEDGDGGSDSRPLAGRQ